LASLGEVPPGPEATQLRWTIGFDHAGYRLAGHVRQFLVSRGDAVQMYGPPSDTPPVDYPPYCFAAALAVAHGDADYGIVIGGSGQGEQIAANKVRGIRAALCSEPHFAVMARRDNDANVMALPGRVVAPEYAEIILASWIGTEFAGGRHVRRLSLIDQYERGDLAIDELAWRAD
jgi:ribose 5-phosphate isomerase B